AAAVDVRVGGAADSPVVALRPIQQIVTALVAGPGPVGDLVALEPGGGEGGLGRQVLGRLVVVVGVPAAVGGQWRARLHGEGVGAEVGRLEGEGAFERRRPVERRLAGGAVDQVEV